MLCTAGGQSPTPNWRWDGYDKQPCPQPGIGVTYQTEVLSAVHALQPLTATANDSASKSVSVASDVCEFPT